MQKLLLTLLLTALTLQLHGCATKKGNRYPPGPDGAPSYHVDVSKIPDAVPKAEPFTKAGNPKSYVALGKRYHVKDGCLNHTETGLASWYGTKFHGQRASNGEKYNLLEMTAAHKTLRLPCYARVTNLENGREVIVKINDRGPFRENRIIDLSFVAAKKLGIYPKGTGMVRITTIDPRTWDNKNLASENQSVTTHKVDHKPVIYMQIGAFASKDNAQRLAAQIQPHTKDTIRIKEAVLNDAPIYKVQIGPMAGVDDSDTLHSELRKANLGTPITVID